MKSQASQLGCVDPDAFVKLISNEDLSEIEVGEDFEVNNESVKKIIENSSKKMPYLFVKRSVNFADGDPSNSKPKVKDIKKMTKEEIIAAIKSGK